MKPRAFRSLPKTLFVCLAPLVAAVPAHASVVAANESNGSGVWTLPTGINLLTGTTPSPATAAVHEGSDTNWGSAIDGTLGEVSGIPSTSCTPSDGNTVTFPLDLTGHPAGRDITSFDSYCTWANSGRDNQDYVLQYSTVADPATFINIHTAKVRTGRDRSTHTRLTDTSGFLAKGVHSIRLLFNGQENGYVGYREFVLQDASPVVCISNENRNDNVWALPPGPNLLNGATATPSAANAHEGSSASWATLTDGAFGTLDVPGLAESVTPNNTDAVTFPLDLAAKPAGYDIVSFDSYSAWVSNGRDDQRYTLEYSTVGAPDTFLPLAEVNNHTEYAGDYATDRRSTHTRVTGSAGILATGVAAVRVTFHDQENGYTGFREFVLRDAASPITVVNEANTTGAWSLPTGANLLNADTATAPDFPNGSNHGNGDITGSTWKPLTDGSLGVVATQTDSVAPLNGTSVVFPLNTESNKNGYNITSFDTYAAWGNSGRDDQNFTILYSTVLDPDTFIPLQTVNNHTINPQNATHTRIASTSGVLATGVSKVQFLFADQENGYIGYREFVAQGSAVPLAGNLTWSGLSGSGGNATWITGTDNNWKAGTVSSAYNSDAPLTFDSTGTNPNISIPTALAAADLTFTNDAAHPYTFSGSQINISNGVTLSGAGNATFNNPLQGNGVVVSGTGSLTLAGANTLSGNASVSSGALNLKSDGALGTASLNISGGNVNFTSTNPLILNLAGTGGAIFLGNPVGNGHTDLAVGDTPSTSYLGTISNASATATGGLIKNGSGTLTLGGANSYTGTTTIAQGRLVLAKRSSLYNGNPASWTDSNLILQGSSALSLRLGGTDGFTSADVAALHTGGFAPTAILSLDTSLGDYVVSNSIGGDIAIEKDGPNTLTLSATNTFAGGITVNAGALHLGNPSGTSIPGDLTIGNVSVDAWATTLFDNQFAATSVLRFNPGSGALNGKFQLRGTHQTVAGLVSGTENRVSLVQNDETTAPGYTTNPGAASITINTPENSFYSFRGIIRNQDGGAVSLIKNGLGTQELINAQVQGNSYNGPTSVNEGKLRINFAGGNTGFGSDITVAAAATLEFNAVGGNYDFGRVIGGDGNIIVQGSNAVVFTNNKNTWTKGVTVGVGTDNGFLAFNGNGQADQGDAAGQFCAGGAMNPSNIISVNEGATLSLDGTAPLGQSPVLPQFAPSIRINGTSRLFGGTNTVAFVANLTLNDGGNVLVSNGANTGGFGTNLALVGTVVVSGTSEGAAAIKTDPSVLPDGATPSPFANVSLGSLGLPGTTFQVADITASDEPDLEVTSTLRDVSTVASSLTKTGLGTMFLSGAETYTGATLVEEGKLTVDTAYLADSANVSVATGAKLNLLHGDLDVISGLKLGGVQMQVGVYGAVGSGAQFTSPLIEGTGTLGVLVGPAISYETWALVIPNAADRGRTADPDGDGFTNLEEFLFGTSPVASTGSLAQIETTDTGLVIHWNERLNSSEKYVVKESATLDNPWTASNVVVTDSSTQNVPDYVSKQAVIPINSPRNFVRVEAVE